MENLSFIVLIILLVLFLLFTLYRSIKVEKINIVLKNSSKWLILIPFLVFATIVYFKKNDSEGITVAALLLIIALIYINLKSGLNNQGIIYQGKFIPYSKLDELEIIKVADQKRLHFNYRKANHFLSFNAQGEKKIEQIIKKYKGDKND